MDSEGRPAAPGQARSVQRLVVVLVWLLIALGFTLVQVRQSLYDGRLAAPPTYDDIAYLADAQTRLHTLYTAGPRQALRDALLDPPHSPWSTGLAALAFLTFGVEEWAPAAANGLLVLGLLLALSWRGRDLPMAWQLAIAVFLLTWPITGQAVVNFRPDIACGLATAWTALHIAGSRWVGASRRRHYLAGGGLGLALLIKPTVSPLTVAVVLTAIAAATLTDVLRGHPWRRWRPILGASSRCLGVAALIAGPYYAVAYRHVYDYVYSNNFGELGELWRLDLATSEQALYYLTGTGGRFLLDAWLYLWLSLAAATLMLVLARRESAILRRLPAAVAVFLVAYALITIPAHKNQFLGALLPSLMLVSAKRMMVHLARTGGRSAATWPRYAGALVLSSLPVAGLALFQWPTHFAPWDSLPPETIQQHRQLLEAVHRDIQQAGDGPARVLFTQIGPYMNPPLLRFRAGLERSREIDALDLAANTDPGDLEIQLAAATEVIAFSPDNPSTIAWLPAASRQQLVLDRLAEHPRFVLERAHPTPGSGQLFLFREVKAFDGVRAVDGLGTIEGPYPELGLAFPVRWGLGPVSRLEIEAPSGGEVRLFLEGSSSLPDQTVTVRMEDRVVAEHTFVRLNEFEQLVVDLELPGGRHLIELHYARWQPPNETESRPLAVLFRTLRAAEPDPGR